MKPNLFIVGAPKCGTTFLYEKLKNHPDIFFPKIKELNFFSYPFLKDNSYYKDFKVGTMEVYLNFYKKATKQKHLVDASVSYFTFDEVPKLINEFNPKVKIIIIYRNPYKRSYSHFLMDKRMGVANKSFIEYIKNPESFHYRQYISNSKYYEQSKKYEKYFGKTNICFLNLENIDNDLNLLFTFLEIEPVEVDFVDKVNENQIAKNRLGRFLLKNRFLTQRLKLISPSKLINFLKPLIYRKSPHYKIPFTDLSYATNLLVDDYELFKGYLKDKISSQFNKK